MISILLIGSLRSPPPIRLRHWTHLRAEGCGIALSGDEYEISVTELAFYVIWHDKHYVDQPPPVAFPPLVPYGTTFPPLSGGTIKL